MMQTRIKLETVSMEERQSVKDALSGLDGGKVFNEAVAAHTNRLSNNSWLSG